MSIRWSQAQSELDSGLAANDAFAFDCEPGFLEHSLRRNVRPARRGVQLVKAILVEGAPAEIRGR
jgi:hypothetical protein